MIIFLVNEKTGSDHGGGSFTLPDLLPTSADAPNPDRYHIHGYDGCYEYIDTVHGSFKRSRNYFVGSPYGWHRVSWG